MFASLPAENVIVFIGYRGGTTSGHCRIRWVYFHWIVSGCSGENSVELLILLFDAMDVLVHGHLLGEDYEESSFCRGEELRLEPASLRLALHCFGSTPTFRLAWQH